MGQGAKGIVWIGWITQLFGQPKSSGLFLPPPSISFWLHMSMQTHVHECIPLTLVADNDMQFQMNWENGNYFQKERKHIWHSSCSSSCKTDIITTEHAQTDGKLSSTLYAGCRTQLKSWHFTQDVSTHKSEIWDRLTLVISSTDEHIAPSLVCNHLQTIITFPRSSWHNMLAYQLLIFRWHRRHHWQHAKT